MKRDAMERPRSTWVETHTEEIVPGYPGTWYARRVGDGELRAYVADEPPTGGWHMSISFIDRRGEPSRYPRWDELADAREQLLAADVGFVMHLPPASTYVALHKTTFHLHEHPPRQEPA